MSSVDPTVEDLERDAQPEIEVEQPDPGPSRPFDPALIRVETKPMTVDLLVSRIKNGEIDLAPDFQREAGLWDDGAQSRLIESLMIRLPIPAFYLDATDDERWCVVDGLQRLSVFDRFINRGALSLTSLEFMTELNGRRWSGADNVGLPRNMQRRILETQVTVYLIQPGTPPEVKFNLFKRINTGGLPLSRQEIRHALNQGEAAAMLKRLAEAPEFRKVAGRWLRDRRMTDRECVLRFLAFALTPWREYASREYDAFLHGQMKRLNAMSGEDRAGLERRFLRAMDAAWRVFGQDAFRKRYERTAPRKPINKALFEAWSIGLDALDDAMLVRLVERREVLQDAFAREMNERSFDVSVSQGTGDPTKVHTRFGRIEAILKEILS